MKKFSGLALMFFSLVSTATAHLSHSAGSTAPEQGFHATVPEVVLMVTSGLLVAGLVYYGFTRSKDPEEYTGGE